MQNVFKSSLIYYITQKNILFRWLLYPEENYMIGGRTYITLVVGEYCVETENVWNPLITSNNIEIIN